MWLLLVFLGLATARLSDDKCKEYYKEPSIRDDLLYEFPHVGLMGYEEEDRIIYRCPATLISESFALVGAFCFTLAMQETPKYVIFGTSYEMQDEPLSDKHLNITEILIHPKYSKIGQRHHALALVKFYPPITLSNIIRPGCLYTNNVNDKQVLTDLLWIRPLWNGTFIKSFKQISSVLPAESCRKVFISDNVDEYSHLCVERKVGEEHFGHMGGTSHVLKNGIPKIVAIDNFGKSVASAYYPDVSTKLYNYLDWIEETVWKK